MMERTSREEEEEEEERRVRVWDQKWKRERERGDMRKTTHGWTVVHSLENISVTFPTSHAERSPLN